MNDQIEALSVKTADTIYASVGPDALLDVAAVLIASFGDNLLHDQGPLAAAVFLAQLRATVDILGKATTAFLTKDQVAEALALINAPTTSTVN